MDQEVSKVTWTGASILAMTAVVAIAVFLFGMGRSITNDTVTAGAKLMLNMETAELRELEGLAADLTLPNIVGLVERNIDMYYVTIDGVQYDADAPTVSTKLKQTKRTTFVVETIHLPDGTWTLNIY